MMRFAVSLVLLACLAQTSFAKDKLDDAKAVPEAVLCKPLCVSACQDCRAPVQQATDHDTNPGLSMNQNTNPYATASREVRPQSQQLRPTEAQAFRARRSERLQACEVQYRNCTRSCS